MLRRGLGAPVWLLVFQAGLIVLYALFAKYGINATPFAVAEKNSTTLEDYYPMFQDVHVMIFVGFGFLMVFLRKYGFSSVGFTLLLGALCVQWAMLCQGFFKLEADSKIHLSIVSLLNADIASAAVLISMGAVLGKTTPVQLVVMGAIEMVFFAVNEHLATQVLQAVDLGGSMVVHVFGAYFGLAVSRALGRPSDTAEESSSYSSDLFAMIGTVFLWLFWPSFNGALAASHARHRAVINTYLALASGCVVAFAVSALVQRAGRFNMVHVQNATLAGGVAMGTAADLLVQPGGALIVGGLAGALSVCGYAFLQPTLQRRLKIHDTCGVHNLHGMPGVLAAIVGAVMATIATQDQYGKGLFLQFPAMMPRSGQLLEDARDYLGQGAGPGRGRSAFEQGGYQLAALAVTMTVSIVSGTVTGYFIRQGKILPQLGEGAAFRDSPHWEVPDEENGCGSPALVVEAVAELPTNASGSKAMSMGHVSSISVEAASNNIPPLPVLSSGDR